MFGLYSYSFYPKIHITYFYSHSFYPQIHVTYFYFYLVYPKTIKVNLPSGLPLRMGPGSQEIMKTKQHNTTPVNGLISLKILPRFSSCQLPEKNQ